MGIHREAPPFIDQSTEQEILVTGIKVGRKHYLAGLEIPLILGADDMVLGAISELC